MNAQIIQAQNLIKRYGPRDHRWPILFRNQRAHYCKALDFRFMTCMSGR
jgi:hypothetical protein